MKLFSPPGAPAWLDGVLRRIRQAVGEPWDSPLRLQSLPTASLPTAADYPAGLVYDSTTAEVKRSNGTIWAAVGGGGSLTDGDKGDITVSGSGATWTVDNGVITLAKQANVATSRIMGRVTAGSGVQEELTGTQATTLLDAFTSGLKGLAPASGGGTSNYLRADGTWAAPSAGGVSDGDKGDITVSSSGAVWTIDAGVVTLAKQADMATASVVYRKTAGSGAPEVQTLATLKTDLGLTGTNSGDQTSVSGNAGSATVLQTSRNFSISGGGITAATVGFDGSAAVVLNASVDAGHITLARMADVATGTIFYRKTAGTGAPEVQTLATLKTDLGLTGTNSGDQTITLTGDVTGSGTGSFAATVGNGVVTLAKMANVATASFIGRVTAGTGVPEALTGTQATTLLDAFTSGLKGLAPASGGGTSNFLRADGTWAAPPGGGGSLTDGDKGDITVSASGATWTIDAGVVTLAKMADVATGTVFYRKTAATGVPEVQTLATLKADLGLTGTNSGDQTITLTGDVTGSGTGSFAATIANNAVSLAKMATIATDSILGRATAATGNVEVLTALPFAYTGDVTRPADSNATTIANDAVTYAKMQNVSATDKLLGRSTAGSGDVEEIACTAAGRAILDDADAAAQRVTLGLSTIAIAFVIDGGGATITTGVKGDITIPFACTITEWTLLADQSGSIQIDIWKDTYANYPPTVADTITASAKPLFSTTTKGQSSTLTGWTTSIAAGDTLRFNVDSVTTCQRVTLSLKVTR